MRIFSGLPQGSGLRRPEACGVNPSQCECQTVPPSPAPIGPTHCPSSGPGPGWKSSPSHWELRGELTFYCAPNPQPQRLGKCQAQPSAGLQEVTLLLGGGGFLGGGGSRLGRQESPLLSLSLSLKLNLNVETTPLGFSHPELRGGSPAQQTPSEALGMDSAPPWGQASTQRSPYRSEDPLTQL